MWRIVCVAALVVGVHAAVWNAVQRFVPHRADKPAPVIKVHWVSDAESSAAQPAKQALSDKALAQAKLAEQGKKQKQAKKKKKRKAVKAPAQKKPTPKKPAPQPPAQVNTVEAPPLLTQPVDVVQSVEPIIESQIIEPQKVEPIVVQEPVPLEITQPTVPESTPPEAEAETALASVDDAMQDEEDSAGEDEETLLLPDMREASAAAGGDARSDDEWLRGGGGAGASSSVSAPTSSVPIVRDITNAEYARNPSPPYPALSRKLGEEGTIRLRVEVNATGGVTRVTVQESSGFGMLDNVARKAVRGWRFQPASRDGQKVASTVLVPVHFYLE